MSPIPNPQVSYGGVPKEYPVPGETTVYQADAQTIDLDNVPLNGGVLTKTLYLSVDPYLRNMMRDPSIASYSSAFQVGSPYVQPPSQILVLVTNNLLHITDCGGVV